MKTWEIFLLIVCLASYTTFKSIRQLTEYFLGAVYDVRVVNGFTRNSSMPLVIWCASEDGNDDLGGRALEEGDAFSWSVRTKFWKTTLFVCTMKWDTKRKKFEAFRAQRDVERCGEFKMCTWMVKEDGFYFSSDELNWHKNFSWP